MSANNARIIVHIGATGSGKSAKMEEELKADAPERLFAWDVKGEWAAKLGIPLVTDWPTAARCLEALKAGKKIRVAYKPPIILEPELGKKQFGRVCWHLHQARDMAFLLEEASLVLEPGTGNAKLWIALVNIAARDQNIALYIITQRPTLMDKSSLSNVTKIRVFKLGYGPDFDTCADTLRVPVAAVEAIKKLEFIERDTDTGTVAAGSLVARFSGSPGEPPPPAREEPKAPPVPPKRQKRHKRR